MRFRHVLLLCVGLSVSGVDDIPSHLHQRIKLFENDL